MRNEQKRTHFRHFLSVCHFYFFDFWDEAIHQHCHPAQVQLWGRTTPDPDRQRGGRAGEREDWEAHHEEHPWRAQPLHFRQCMFTPKIRMHSTIVLQEVNKKIENVYSKFKHMLLKRDDTSKNAMTSILTKWVHDFFRKKSHSCCHVNLSLFTVFHQLVVSGEAGMWIHW